MSLVPQDSPIAPTLTAEQLAAVFKDHAGVDVQKWLKQFHEFGTLAKFGARCAMDVPRIAFYAKLYRAAGVEDAFLEAMTHDATPLPSDEPSLVLYLDTCRRVIAEIAIARQSPQALEDAALKDFVTYACHFTGKIVHSSAEGAAVLLTPRSTDTAHVSARRILQDGFEVALEQAVNANGGYQRLVKVLERDPIVAQAELPQDHIEAIERAWARAQPLLRTRPIPRVDFRLRQLLVPSGDNYLAISPLGSGALTRAFYREGRALVSANIEARKALAPQIKEARQTRNQATKALNKVLKTSRKAQPVAALAELQASLRQAQADLDRLEGEVPDEVSFESIELSGGNPMNITLRTEGFKQPWLFDVPGRQDAQREVWRFVFKPFRVVLPPRALAKYLAKAQAFQESDLGAQTTMLAQDIHRKVLHALVREVVQDLQDFAFKLETASFSEPTHAAQAITVGLLRAHRGAQGVSALDEALATGRLTGEAFRDEVARQILAQLGAAMADKGLVGQAMQTRQAEGVRDILKELC